MNVIRKERSPPLVTCLDSVSVRRDTAPLTAGLVKGALMACTP